MPNATTLIKRDHKKVEDLFARFEHSTKAEAKKRVAEQACAELEIHAQLEEEIFYPAVRKGLGEEDTLEEAVEEHQQAKKIIGELKKMSIGDSALDGKFAELVECIQHHVREEEGELLPKVEESDMDLVDIGEQMVECREELTQQMKKTRSQGKSARKPKSTSRRRKSGRAA